MGRLSWGELSVILSHAVYVDWYLNRFGFSIDLGQNS